MKKRIGSDIPQLKWKLYFGGEEYNWNDLHNLKVVAKQTKRPANIVIPTRSIMTGNELELYFSAADLELGKYTLQADFAFSDVTSPTGKVKAPIDWVDAFEIVEHTFQEDSEGSEFTTDIKFGVNGLSAYEAYKKYCIIEGIEYLSETQYLLGPATAYAAAAAANNAIHSLSQLEASVTEYENTRIQNEQNRVSAEELRDIAEGNRNQAEQSRASAEELRDTAEGNRDLAEQGRASAEELRDTAEGIRDLAEQSRASAEELRDTAEGNRDLAEQGRASAEELRDTAEGNRDLAEQGRASAEELRDTAEGNRDLAEQGRASAEELRDTAEGVRNQLEQNRVSSEELRDTAEVNRELSEQNRASSEELRDTAEGVRNQSEQNRVSSEELRNTAEVNRELAEQNRISAEELRDTAEGNRNQAEQNRASAEELRDTAEGNRNQAEQSRASAEELREQNTSIAINNANNVANTYAAELALKELKANKQNSLETDGTGTKFPTVDAVNAGLASAGNNLIASYTHTSNVEIAVTDVDISTNTFIKIAHGLVDGDKISPVLNKDAGKILPLEVYPTGLFANIYYVINKTDDTFQVSATKGGVAVDITATGNLSKWHFETFDITYLTFNNLPAKSAYRVTISGKNLIDNNVMIMANNKNLVALDWKDNNLPSLWRYPTAASGLGTYVGFLETIIQSGYISYLHITGNTMSLNNTTPTTLVVTNINSTTVSTRPNVYGGDITALLIDINGRLANGGIVNIYNV